MLASATVNTDFAETEVDTRRTNLTRFPLFFPEKRTFFLEGDDIFSFGLGLDQDVIPYFSRRIGLIEGREVPILAGGKVNGRDRQHQLRRRGVGTRPRRDVIDEHTFMAVGRVKRNLWRESWVGAIATVGDPLGRAGSWLGGADFTYATSRFRGDKNFLVGVWGLATGREDLGSDSTAHGFKVDYPNDLLDMAVTYKRIGRDFDPSIGFVPRPAVQLWNVGANLQPALAARSDSADVLRVRAVARHRSLGTLGELSRVLGADQLAVSQRRSRGVQRQSDRRASRPSRSRSPTAWSFRRVRTTGCGTASKPAPRRSGGSTRR